MRRPKIGDVFYTKVPNGYKIYQYAYDIPTYGSFIRVFDGLYTSIPENIEQIVNGPHSYIIGAYIPRFSRIGLAQFITHIPVPAEYPYPGFCIHLWPNQRGVFSSVWVSEAKTEISQKSKILSFDVTALDMLPEEFRNITMLSHGLSPDILLYLFDCDFDLKDNINRFFFRTYLGDTWEETLKKYGVYIDDLLAKAGMKKRFYPNG